MIFFLLSLQKIFTLPILLTRSNNDTYSISGPFLTKIDLKSYGENHLMILDI
jgi:hypothetical protein